MAVEVREEVLVEVRVAPALMDAVVVGGVNPGDKVGEGEGGAADAVDVLVVDGTLDGECDGDTLGDSDLDVMTQEAPARPREQDRQPEEPPE